MLEKITVVFTKWWFSVSIISSTSINWNSAVRKSFPFSSTYVFICLPINIDSWILISLYAIIHYNHCLFHSSDCPRFGHWEPFQVGSSSYLTFLSLFFFFSTCLFSGTKKCSRLIFAFTVPTLDFSKDSPWRLYLENCVRKQGLGTRCSHWY